jgi:hypothetical protein
LLFIAFLQPNKHLHLPWGYSWLLCT